MTSGSPIFKALLFLIPCAFFEKKEVLLSREMSLTEDETEKLLHFRLVPRALVHLSLITTVLFLVKFLLALSLFKFPLHVALILSRCFSSRFLLKCSKPNW